MLAVRASVRPSVALLLMSVAVVVACVQPQPPKLPPAEGSTLLSVPPPRGPCPEEMALVGDHTCVDRWEASLVEVTPSGERPFSPYESPEETVVRAVSRPGVVPQGYISRDQAERACREANKRLCTESEWVTACTGAQARAFPYGKVREKGACNDSGVAPLAAALQGFALDVHQGTHE